MGGNSTKLGPRAEGPIFSVIIFSSSNNNNQIKLLSIKDKVILSCGGGGENYGIKNHLVRNIKNYSRKWFKLIKSQFINEKFLSIY